VPKWENLLKSYWVIGHGKLIMKTAQKPEDADCFYFAAVLLSWFRFSF
jgi:hypothetical protein